jgi:hypothetical protein
MWFMLGQSLANSSHAKTTVMHTPAQASQPTNGNLDLGPGETTKAVNEPAIEEAIEPQAEQIAEPEPESVLVSLLRTFLWTVVIVAGFWLVRGFVRMRNRLSRRQSHYNLGN